MRNGKTDSYALLDSGNGNKLERFGPYTFVRPCAAAVWRTSLPAAEWDNASARFGRDGGCQWTYREPLPSSWNIDIDGLVFKLSVTGFGHVGVFPEQRECWKWIRNAIGTGARDGRRVSVLNLFAYSGGSTLAAAKAGAEVCHLDASRGMVARARENAELNDLAGSPVRWIVDDVNKFLDRELRRESRYDGIILDPPSFGRGKSGEVYKIETDLVDTIKKCASLLGPKPLFVLLSCHTPAFTPLVLEHILRQTLCVRQGAFERGEMVLSSDGGAMAVPSGTFARWSA